MRAYFNFNNWLHTCYTLGSCDILSAALDYCTRFTRKNQCFYNMAVTESDLNPRFKKCPQLLNDCAENGLSMRSRSWNITDSKKNIFPNLLFEADLSYDRPQRCPMILYRVNLWLKPSVSNYVSPTLRLYTRKATVVDSWMNHYGKEKERNSIDS